MGTKPATRRVKLHFDGKGNPACYSTTSPESFNVHAALRLPPRDVIPVIFVPGVMGSNVALRKEEGSDEPGEIVWRPPNGAIGGIQSAWQGSNQKPAERQKLFDPDKTVVDDRGPCRVTNTVDFNYWVTKDAAQKRGWGTVHQESYHDFLSYLEDTLNERITSTGELKADLLQTQFLGSPAGKLPGFRASYAETAEYSAKVTAGIALKKWQTPSPPPPVAEEDTERLGKYYFPVHAHGYNWLRDNDEAATLLLKKIKEVVEQYQKSDYFECAGKVILVTHSMGGLVARRAAQQAPDQIIGVVHGALPVVGAAVLYRRMRAGMEIGGAFDIIGKLAAQVIGSGSPEITASICRAPGPLELAPTKDYPMNWLRIAQGDKFMTDQKSKTLFSLPKKDPYTEIYSKTTDDCWWAMVDPALIDPLGTIRKDGFDPAEEYKKAIGIAEDFHDTLGLYAHPETYGFYGIDNKDYRSYGHVVWSSQFYNSRPSDDLMAKKFYSTTSLGSVDIPVQERPPYAPVCENFKLLLDRNQEGDGTVPLDSGAMLRRLQNIKGQDRVFGIEGFDHQGAYNSEFSRQATVYFLTRIARNAPPLSPPKGGVPPC
ncbi:MAG: alpha/beta hydrolase [Proteobacteria bacterium]|nr:alpha/beta hydrolase [Pseudomonadota bacterium]